MDKLQEVQQKNEQYISQYFSKIEHHTKQEIDDFEQKQMNDPLFREQVSLYIKENPKIFENLSSEGSKYDTIKYYIIKNSKYVVIVALIFISVITTVYFQNQNMDTGIAEELFNTTPAYKSPAGKNNMLDSNLQLVYHEANRNFNDKIKNPANNEVSYEEILKQYEQILKVDSTLLRVNHSGGIAAYKSKQYQSAIVLLERALKADEITAEEKEEAHFYLAGAYVKLKDNKQAAQHINHVISMQRTQSKYYELAKHISKHIK
jgi:tetratricopeptide (TPR) repeat protein